MSEKDGASQMSEPVAWARIVDGCLIQLKAVDPKDARYIPLYASSYAMGVADAAKLHDEAATRQKDAGDNFLATYESAWADAIRALSSPPSVTEEWCWKVATKDGLFKRVNCDEEYESVLATLAALGIKVRSNDPAPEIFPGTMDALNALKVTK